MRIYSRSITLVLSLLVFSSLAWPAHGQEGAVMSEDNRQLIRAVVTDVTSAESEDPNAKIYTVRIEEGPDKGKTNVIGDDELISSVGYTTYQKNDRVMLGIIDKENGSRSYIINDYDRRMPLFWIVVVFMAAIIWLSRWRGLRSLIGLGVSYLVIIKWIIPRIIDGDSPIQATVLGGAVILVVALVLTEGLRRSTWAAATGMVVTMLAIGLLSQWSVAFARLTGGASEEAFYLQGQGFGNIDVRGLLLAGFIIGTLGLLDDIAVSQVALVGELRRASPRQSGRAIYQAALRVGRSHMAAIVNTLVLAYAGTSLPLLVLFQASGAQAGLVVNSEIVATEIVRSVVGSLGLVLALPLTTAIAVWFKVKSDHPHEEMPISVGHDDSLSEKIGGLFKRRKT